MVLAVVLALATQAPAHAQISSAARVDPLSFAVDLRDAFRFARLMADTDYRPSARQIEEAYLKDSGRGVEIFTPGRIENAENLARAIAAEPERYRYAIETCLPVVESTNAELRATYLAFRGLLPEFPLPAVTVLFGAGNSGGTAAPDMQVIGLEVICGPGTTVE